MQEVATLSRKPSPIAPSPVAASFAALVNVIADVNAELTAQAARAVNVSLTMRNWLIGFYIEEYERNGIDRQQYGEKLLDHLAGSLTQKGVSRCDRRELYRYRQFYLVYPQIVESVTPQFRELLVAAGKGTLGKIVDGLTPQSRTDGHTLLTRLSFTHLAELIALDDGTQRNFYERECLRGNWSVRELRRQVASLYYERSGLSHDKEQLAALAQKGAEQAEPQLTIRDPYIFEFLGLRSAEVMGESHLEDQLLDKLKDFLLELGHGFCFEARQKRILIGDTHGFIDLVFYHRVLKCHVLVELKVANFSHENIGQLNTYVSWYRKNVTIEGDNPPIGILLCTQKDHALVEYALAGMDNRLFVSRYQLELPRKEDMQRFLEAQISTQIGSQENS